MTVIDGRAIAQAIRVQCKERVRRLARERGLAPGLAVILVGEDAASEVYVRNKVRACADVGIRSQVERYPAQVAPALIEERIDALNADSAVHGILVQLPLPAQFDRGDIVRRIDAAKDVDGFHLYNVGALVVGGSVFPPCTP